MNKEEDFSIQMLAVGYDEGRILYKIGDETLVKIPYNQNGIRMNADEWKIYSEASDGLKEKLASCSSLDENGWLFMEYIKDYTSDWESYKNGSYINCLKYDYSYEKNVQFTCDFQCAECVFNHHFLKKEDLKSLSTVAYTPRWQVGQDSNLKCKFYNFTDVELQEGLFLYNAAYDSLFSEYLEEGEYDILFCDWIKKKKNRAPVMANSSVEGEFIALANRARRRMMLKKKQSSMKEEI